MRRKIVLAALVLGIGFLVVFSLGFYLIRADITSSGTAPPQVAFIEAYNFLAMAGMYVVNFLCIAIAALLTADTLAGEIQSGTVQATLSKPIPRSAVVVGKWLGQAVLLLLYLLLMAGGVVLSIWLQSGYALEDWWTGLALLYLNSLLIMSLTLAMSSTFTTLATGGAVFGAYGLAFIGGWVERLGTVFRNQTAMDLGIVSSLLLPSEAIWNKAGAVMTSPLARLTELTPFTSASEPSTVMMIYAVLYLLGAVWIAIYRFEKRDV